MNEHNSGIAVFPGTFDPVTHGHVDVIRRGAALFGELIVAVGTNPDKSSLLPETERTELVRKVAAGLGVGNLRVEAYSGLTVDFARRAGAAVLLRGLRDSADLAFEAHVAQTNRRMTGIETVFLLTSPELAYISSGLVRQIARAGGDVCPFVPPEVAAHLARLRADESWPQGAPPPAEPSEDIAPQPNSRAAGTHQHKKRRQGRGA